MKNPVQCATLDMDATLIATQKKEGLFSYKGGSDAGMLCSTSKRVTIMASKVYK